MWEKHYISLLLGHLIGLDIEVEIVIITAVGVGGATIFGGLLGLILRRISKRANDIFLAFAAGVMLCAAVLGLILPSLEGGGITISIFGIFLGAFCISLIDRLMPLLSIRRRGTGKVYLFVLAIAIHNLPEGIAAGVGFGTGDVASGILIAAGIALQNIPEGMVVILPMIGAGISPKKSFFIAALTGIVEIFGTIMGYFVVNVANNLLPFALAFAGGTMLRVVNCEMIAEVCSGKDKAAASYSLLLGFCVMLALNVIL